MAPCSARRVRMLVPWVAVAATASATVPAMSLVVADYRQYRCHGKTKWKRHAQFRTEAIVLRSGLAMVPAHLLTPLPASLETERVWRPLGFAPEQFPLLARQTSYQVNGN